MVYAWIVLMIFVGFAHWTSLVHNQGSLGSLFLYGTILLSGFIFGEIARGVRLPKVTGYILAGILLNPQVSHIVTQEFVAGTKPITDISLSFITFTIGAALIFSRIRNLGRGIISITFFGAEFPVILVGAGFVAVLLILKDAIGYSWSGMVLVPSILLASLASPTDPAVNLAVIHEYGAKGSVSSTILGTSGLDDILGIVNFSIFTTIGRMIITNAQFSFYDSVFTPLSVLLGGIAIGIIFGVGFNLVTTLIARESEGSIIVYVFALLFLCYSTARFFGLDELLASMTMGIVVGNYNSLQEKIIGMLERYTEELIFVLFFTLSGMHLDFSLFLSVLPFVALFVLLRFAGKYLGAVVGARAVHSPKGLGRNVGWGLIPQGGIVVGLALFIGYDQAFDVISQTVIAIIIGATVIHEVIGPVLSKAALVNAGEIRKSP